MCLGSQRLDNQASLLQMLREMVRDMAEGTRMIYLKADVDLPYSEVMKIMDLEDGARELLPGEVGEIVDSGPIVYAGEPALPLRLQTSLCGLLRPFY